MLHSWCLEDEIPLKVDIVSPALALVKSRKGRFSEIVVDAALKTERCYKRIVVVALVVVVIRPQGDEGVSSMIQCVLSMSEEG